MTKLGIAELSAEALRPFVGKKLEFQRPVEDAHITNGRVELELMRVTVPESALKIPQSAAETSARRVSFSALFVLAPDGQPLGMGLHRLMHPDFEPEEWFLSRVYVPGEDMRRAYYEAIFG